MEKAIIDVGSNSVRLAIFADGNIVLRDKITSRLGEGLSISGKISDQAFERNLIAITSLINKALEQGVEKQNILPFGTAALRQGENGKEFIDRLKSLTGIQIDVLSEQDECLAGTIGALGDSDGAMIDIGGASSELSIQQNKKIIYSKSVNTGAVKLTEQFGEKDLEDFVWQKLNEYTPPAFNNLTAIGGTCSSIAYTLSGDLVFNVEKNHGRFVPITDLYAHLLVLKGLTPIERSKKFNIDIERAKTIYSGGVFIYNFLKKFNLSGYRVSESDNIQGYYLLKGENI